MPLSPLQCMQDAVDKVPESQHPTNKIAATLFGTDSAGKDFKITEVNQWPAPIAEKVGTETTIGNSSGTIHAETACVLKSPAATEGASLCITDPFCPNCAKNIAEAGIKAIYIDHKGFQKDFFARRGDHFESMSMRICERAGINVYEVRREAQEITSILEIPRTYVPVEDSPIEIEAIENASDAVFRTIVQTTSVQQFRRKFAIAFVGDRQGRKLALTARRHAVTGFSAEDPDDAIDVLTPIGKYSFIQEPVNRLLMQCSRRGYKMIEGFLYCSQIPTAREQVNLVGAGLSRITIGDMQKSRDHFGREAMEILRDKGVISYI